MHTNSRFFRGGFLALILLGAGMMNTVQAGSITLTGTGATETNGNGWALLIPDLDATSPGVYDPVQVAPKNPFNIGSITWNDSLVPATGAVNVAVTDAMCVWNFADYVQDVVNKLAVIGTGGARITLSSITGPGLSFKNGVLETINFTAEVSWIPTLNGFNASQPYFGTLTFVDGVFTWNMSRNTANWFIGATDVHFEFDLKGTVQQLARPLLPEVVATPTSNGEISLALRYPLPSTATFRLVYNDGLTGAWTPIGTPFTSETAPPFTALNPQGLPRRFYRVERISP